MWEFFSHHLVGPIAHFVLTHIWNKLPPVSKHMVVMIVVLTILPALGYVLITLCVNANIRFLSADLRIYLILVILMGVTAMTTSSLTNIARREKVYHPHNASDFYNSVASEYDQHNQRKPEFRASHTKICRRINEYLNKLALDAKVNILDLGGGTGLEIANGCKYRTNITWHYVDFSEDMRGRFSKNLTGSTLTFTYDDSEISRYVHDAKPGIFDIVVMSFVLSSMPENPDLGVVAALLKPSGILVVADIHNVYAMQHQLFQISVGDVVHALRIRPINPLVIKDSLHAAGLTNGKLENVQRREQEDPEGLDYSFICVFKKP